MTETAERTLARFVVSPPRPTVDVEQTVKRVILTTLSTAVAGAAEPGVAELRDHLRNRGGRPEATTFVFADPLPAGSAAMLNGVMCRALDYCDAMFPGLHTGSSLVPAALAASQVVGGCTGADFLAAVTTGAELSARFNLRGDQYDGFDPTGVAGVFGATSACSRILGLTEDQTLNALALAFNRCGGSFQSNVDGSLAVRLIQGWVAESALMCAQLARAGFTGPARFLTGIYGYLHLFARDASEPADIIGGLGDEWRLTDTVFKRYPSCGGTQAITHLALEHLAHVDCEERDIASVRVELPVYTYKLVGHEFTIGDNPRVDAQFSAQYCVASALLRGDSRLADFTPAAIRNEAVLEFASRVRVEPSELLGIKGNPCAVLHVTTADGRDHEHSMEIPPGFPGNSLSSSEHSARLADCADYAPYLLADGAWEHLQDIVADLAQLQDTGDLLAVLTARETIR